MVRTSDFRSEDVGSNPAGAISLHSHVRFSYMIMSIFISVNFD